MTSIADRQEQVRTLLDSISEKHGYLSKAFLSTLTPSQRREVEKSSRNKDTLISASITTLANNLYSSKARFVYELIQNAEDNSYNKAHKNNTEPFISFEVHPRQIVIKYNEDGFTDENVQAICAIGKSSRTGPRTYIGPMGIGFKSVFMVASKVSIQSGPFSFFFEHEQGDKGFGLVSPIWQEPETSIEGPMTRITLTLNKQSDPQKAAEQWMTIVEQFEKLPRTLLLFLNNLKRLEINIHKDSEIGFSSTVYSTQHGTDKNKVTLTKIYSEGGVIKERTEDLYHVTRRQVSKLAQHDGRNYSVEDLQNKTYENAEVVLAFPIGVNDIPVISYQEVFAILPIRSFGFSFLIHSDFVTQASREDIVENSERNIGLLVGVAEAFTDAVKQFCKHPTLQYQWMRYLPNNITSGPFWTKLLPMISESLAKSPVLRPRSCGPLRLIKDLRELETSAKDYRNRPLFDDLDIEIYLSAEYLMPDIKLLRSIGLQIMDFWQLIDRARADLQKTDGNSKFRSPHTDEDWHSRVANLLSIPFEKKYFFRFNIRSLSLIPLVQNGMTWTSINDGKVFYSDTQHIPIPGDLGFRLLHPIAVHNPARQKFFNHLGVGTLTTNEVREAIFQKYANPRISPDISIFDSAAHLKYLYRTNIVGEARPSTLWVYDQNMNRQFPDQQDIYIRTSDKYGAWDLFKHVVSDPALEQIQGLELEISFLHGDYSKPKVLENAPVEITWDKWLSNYIKAQQLPRIDSLKSSESQLSDLFKYITKVHSLKVLEVLKYHWESYKPLILGSPRIHRQISDTRVLCKDLKFQPLNKTYLPDPKLVEKCSEFTVIGTGEGVPFLRLMHPEHFSCQEWNFLTDLGVGASESVQFYLQILSSIVSLNKDASSIFNFIRVYRLYAVIAFQMCRAEDKETARKKIRDFFKTFPAIFVPAHGPFEASWVHPDECLWEAPADAMAKVPIKSLCAKHILPAGVSQVDLFFFFHTVLGLRNFMWEDILDELIELSRLQETNQDRAQEFYLQLDKKRREEGLSSEYSTKIRNSFYENNLVYGEESWFPVSACVWSNTTEITGKIVICDLYPNLKDFFVDFIGVKASNLNMFLGELRELARVGAPVDKIKSVIWAVNMLLQTEDTQTLPESLLDVAILPVRLGDQVILQSPMSDYAIIDHQKYADAYWGEAWMLDFTVIEVYSLQPFFTWLSLERRYLSRMVKEIFASDTVTQLATSNLEQDLRFKAHALFQCAVYLDSPRASSIYGLFLNAKVYETDEISSHLSLSQDGREIIANLSKSKLYAREVEDILRVYIPRDTREQELCYLGLLPQRLLEIIMTDPITQIQSAVDSTALVLIGNILKCSSHIVDDLLDEAGIIPVEVPDCKLPSTATITNGSVIDQELEDDDSSWASSSEQDLDTESDSQGSVTEDTPPSSVLLESSPRQNLGLSEAASPRAMRASARASKGLFQKEWDFPIIQSPPSALHDSISQYKALLEKVIKISKTTGIPHKNAPVTSDGRNRIPAEFRKAFGSRSQNKNDHDSKIGAAGELFVFEVLCRLRPLLLPDFGLANWKSKIRNYVKVHDKYSKIDGWDIKEIADIMYDDEDGILTKHLLGKGYLTLSHLDNHPYPQYYLEVKTTTRKFDAAFYVSNGQYEMMEEKSARHYEPDCKPTVYILIRVYNLGGDDMDMRLYIDPARLERDKNLLFTPNGFKVTPIIQAGSKATW